MTTQAFHHPIGIHERALELVAPFLEIVIR